MLLLLLAGLAALLSRPPRSVLACCALARCVAGGESSSDTYESLSPWLLLSEEGR